MQIFYKNPFSNSFMAKYLCWGLGMKWNFFCQHWTLKIYGKIILSGLGKGEKLEVRLNDAKSFKENFKSIF